MLEGEHEHCVLLKTGRNRAPEAGGKQGEYFQIPQRREQRTLAVRDQC